VRGEAIQFEHSQDAAGGAQVQTHWGGTPGRSLNSDLRIKRFGLVEYQPTYAAMRQFTSARRTDTPDELWLLQHPPIYTAGLACRPEHLPRDSRIPLARIDRGGQITYHGPGQVVMYTLLDLARRDLKIRTYVGMLEQAVINTLALYRIAAQRQAGAPGIYVDGAKIAALGLRVRSAGCYHGVALNVDMDLSPFLAIDPCGYPGLAVTQTRDLGVSAAADELGERLAAELAHILEDHERGR
jgi:lipoyl(octanoyl) transferase